MLCNFLFLLLFRKITCMATQGVWHRGFINGSLLNNTTFQIVSASDVECALKAFRLQWPNVLWFSGRICQLARLESFVNYEYFPATNASVEIKWLFMGKCISRVWQFVEY